ncbi:hypothetical protein QU481_15010 [Crenobacter sp. SG2303]|uniref:Adhesin n=1 Tax=Crenobacter oryzisoli TaxID=3056844 RepID=A0ABT7XRI7_9NEIS|nr:hypothetical protein [Crenobacter sp. SG2303]MDN0076194.1 hypothetical protein [Crenobacter sp. SG2303]
MKKLALAVAVALALGSTVAMAGGDRHGGNKTDVDVQNSFNKTDVDVNIKDSFNRYRFTSINKQESKIDAHMHGSTTGTKVEGGDARASSFSGAAALSGAGARANAEVEKLHEGRAGDAALAAADADAGARASNGGSSAYSWTVVGSGDANLSGNNINGVGAIAQSTGYSSLIQQQNNVSVNAQVGGK